MIKKSILLLLLFSIITGGIYPITVTILAQLLFPAQSNGSLIIKNKHIVGSEFIGQYFDSPNYFQGRPSATSPFPYNAAASQGSNLGPTNTTWIELVKSRIEKLHKNDFQPYIPIPVELVTASGSGLDPHISPLAAVYQIQRVSKARQVSEDDLKELVFRFTEKRQFVFLGEARINLLKLNLALDELTEKKSK